MTSTFPSSSETWRNHLTVFLQDASTSINLLEDPNAYARIDKSFLTPEMIGYLHVLVIVSYNGFKNAVLNYSFAKPV